MTNGTSKSNARPASLAARIPIRRFLGSRQARLYANASVPHRKRMARENRMRAKPDQSRNNLPLVFPESHDAAPMVRARDQRTSAARDQVTRGPRSAR